MRKRKIAKIGAGCLVACILLVAGLYASVSVFPSVGAQGAELLRNLIGDDATAQVESLVFQAQDLLHRMQSRSAGEPASPWAVAVTPTQKESSVPAPIVALPAKTAIPTKVHPPTATSGSALPTIDQTQTSPAATVPPTPTAEPPWSLTALKSLGSMPGEGQWSPYLFGADTTQPLAYRTFLQPDPSRTYALAAVVAFDLSRSRLHFVLGIDEPASNVKVDRSGIIDPKDKQPGVLLAVFNGGFKARHGHYGVMVNNTVVIPPRDGMGTLSIDTDGTVRIGEWATEITPTARTLIWRQNGPLIVHKGVINPMVDVNSIDYWGSTVDGAGVVPTWRSAIGISQDGKTLYYVVGPSLTMRSLADALYAAGVDNAIQLDINNYWAYFGAVVFDRDKPHTQPLFPEWTDNPDRYLYPYTRDFFYMTVK